MEDQFLTLKTPSEGYYMDRGSKFHAYASPVSSESEFSVFLLKIKKEHPKARHYCTALRLFPDASLERSNDDGEPSGSAGRPILGQMVKNDLTNVLIIVVRYFGGTKLGVPGLIEAYKTSAANAIASGRIVRHKVFTKVMIKLSYDSFPQFLNYCKQNLIPVYAEAFADEASIVIGLPKSSCKEDLQKTLHQYSLMDFHSVEDYATHLGMEVSFLNEEVIFPVDE